MKYAAIDLEDDYKVYIDDNLENLKKRMLSLLQNDKQNIKPSAYSKLNTENLKMFSIIIKEISQ